MTYTRIKSNLLDGTYCGDWLVIASDTVKALEKFYREYPEHKGNRITVEPFDPENGESAKKLYDIYKSCNCIF